MSAIPKSAGVYWLKSNVYIDVGYRQIGHIKQKSSSAKASILKYLEVMLTINFDRMRVVCSQLK